MKVRTKSAEKIDSARRAKRRDELLHIAADIFAKKGYHGASMREIAELWGVQPAALYYYYPSKDMLLNAICQYGIGQYLSNLRAIQSSSVPIKQKLNDALRSHLEPLIERQFYVQAFLFQRRQLPKSIRKPLDSQAREYELLWRCILEEGQQNNIIPKSLDLDISVLAILGMCNALARWSRHASSLDLDQVSKVFTHIISTGILIQAPAK
jgi:AcrR family transcriptional regulator